MTSSQPTAAMRLVDAPQLSALVHTHLDVPESPREWLWAEALRTELTARGSTPRRALVDRVCGLIECVAPVDREALVGLCRRLESIGDVTRGPGGMLAAAPLRMVHVNGDRAIVVGTVPTARLRRAVRRVQFTEGVPRRAVLEGGAGALVEGDLAEVGGVVLSAERWSGLDREPALERVLDELDARLDAPHRHESRALAVALARVEMYVPDPGEPRGHRRWKPYAPGETSTVVRERQPGGWTAYAWERSRGAGVPPERSALTSDEARRATFALDARAHAPLELEAALSATHVELRAPFNVPRAEFRYLVAASESVSSEGYPVRYRMPRDVWPRVSSVLRAQLGVELREIEDG